MKKTFIKKTFFITIIAICLTLSSCGEFYGITHAVVEETGETQAGIISSPELAREDENAPYLPDIDFSGMDFFDDGYEVVKYSRTTDGDTATFIMGGLNVKCRFIGIDTPELDHERGDHEPYAEDARDFTERKLDGADIIILERDAEAGEYDNYDRLLAHVWVDGKLLGYMLVSEGLATTRYYREEYKYYDEVAAAENVAREDEKGVWGNNQ